MKAMSLALGAAVLVAGCGGSPTASVPVVPSTTAASVAATTPAAAPTSAAAATSGAAASASSGVPCGVNLADKAVGAGIMAQPIEPVTSSEWSMTPIGGNFDPCATLTVAIITIENATGSSPEQALLFHEGSYVGVSSTKTQAFMSLAPATTADTVVLAYRSGQSCTACSDGTTTDVSFRWDGSKVVQTGTIPPRRSG